MDKFLESKIFIKDNFKSVLIISGMLSILFAIIGYIKINLSTLLTLEQTLFVALSAVLIVFHESIISYSVLSSLTDKLSKLRKDEIQVKVLSYIDSKSSAKEYQDYLSQLESNIAQYKVTVQDYKKSSYLIYAIFSFLGIGLILFVLLFKIEQHFILSFILYFQINLLLIWIYSAFQSDKQKHSILNTLKTKQISIDLKIYIKQNEEKSIENSLEFDV